MRPTCCGVHPVRMVPILTETRFFLPRITTIFNRSFPKHFISKYLLHYRRIIQAFTSLLTQNIVITVAKSVSDMKQINIQASTQTGHEMMQTYRDHINTGHILYNVDVVKAVADTLFWFKTPYINGKDTKNHMSKDQIRSLLYHLYIM